MHSYISRCANQAFRSNARAVWSGGSRPNENRGTKLFSRWAVLGALVCLFQAGGAQAESLQEALDAAYARNPELEAERALERASSQVVRQAKAAYGPTLSATAAGRYAYYERQTARGPAGEDGFGTDLSLELSQTLFTSGRLAARVEEAKAGRLVARDSLRARGQQIVLDVVTAYAELRRDIELHAVAVEIRALLRSQHDASTARLRLRDATAPDVDQTENRLEVATANVLRARATVMAGAARYRNLVGRFPNTLDALPDLPPFPSLQELYTQGEVGSPDLAAMRHAEQVTRARLAAARAEQGPVIASELVGRKGPVSMLEPSFSTKTITAGLSLSMPLYNAGLTLAHIREAVERNRAAQEQVEQARRDIRESIASNLDYARAAEEAMPRYRAAVEAAERAVVGVKRQERAGIRTLRDVLDVTNDLLVARTDAARAKAELYVRKVSVLRAAGLLEPEIFSLRADPDPIDDAGADRAGLPLGPILAPIDRLLLSDGVRDAAAAREDDAVFQWEGPQGAEKSPAP